ncbi:hypothetical protein LRS05_09765 [Flavobacterium sp. J372]|uniref:hypothetical protein n=1 Tax=Flavobacterium sp. J372 TaxID=2898436 RepID=UPI002150B3C7|nr:hypothetical protein [Flavobacterium sp. J372]MCR5862416.1 hypothetical protein [Flavobacterium sp. J372]
MRNDKLTAIGALLLAAAIFFFIFTEAFHLISAPSDISVLLGVLLLCAAILVVFKLIVYAFKKLF